MKDCKVKESKERINWECVRALDEDCTSNPNCYWGKTRRLKRDGIEKGLEVKDKNENMLMDEGRVGEREENILQNS